MSSKLSTLYSAKERYFSPRRRFVLLFQSSPIHGLVHPKEPSALLTSSSATSTSKGMSHERVTRFSLVGYGLLWRLTCPSFVRKLLARFIEVIATSSLALSACASENAPRSCQVIVRVRVTYQTASFNMCSCVLKIPTLISLNAKSSDVRVSFTNFKLWASKTAPCN